MHWLEDSCGKISWTIAGKHALSPSTLHRDSWILIGGRWQHLPWVCAPWRCRLLPVRRAV